MKITQHKKRNQILSLILLAIFVVLLAITKPIFGSYVERILIISAIYAICALSMNITNGFAGLFSLGIPGFMAIGAYVCTLLSLPPEIKEIVYYVKPIVPWLANVQLPIFFTMILGGLFSAGAAFLCGFPVLRLNGDYLAIATLGFSEIIRLILSNMQSVTNGATGISQIPSVVNIWVAFGILAVITIFLLSMMNTTYGRALKSIREDEIAAEAMGIDLFKHKMMALMLSGFIAGIAGALMASLLTAVDPNQFKFATAFTILLMVVLGGQGSISGSIVGAFAVTIAQEVLRVVDEPINFGFFQYTGFVGMRMVIFSVVLMFILIFWNDGIFGTSEFSFDRLFNGINNLFSKKKKTEADLERGKDI